MYLDFYGLTEAPFSLTPDPRFVFLSERHREALAHLLYGVGQGGASGFVQLTGEIGTGKTTLSRLLLEHLPDSVQPALILSPRLSPLELLEAIAEEFGIDSAPVRGSLKGLTDALNVALLEAHANGRRAVVIIDEAQNLGDDALEQLRLLTNLETARDKLLQIILLGQPELREQLARPELKQLAQRITARYHLAPLDGRETDQYLRHRMAVAGAARFPFASAAVRALHRRAHGVPRLINIIAERALLAGYVADSRELSAAMVEHAADEVGGEAARPRASRQQLRWAGLGGLVLIVGLAAALWFTRSPDRSPEGAAIALERSATRPPPAAVSAPPAANAAAPLAVNNAAPAPLDDAQRVAAELAALAAQPQRALEVWAALLERWDALGSDAALAQACPARIRGALRCTRVQASIERLIALDRPAILRLRGDAGEVPANWIGMRGERVVIDLGQGLRELSRDELARWWTGEALYVWRETEALPLLLARGDRGPAVIWLHRQLSRFDRLAAMPDTADRFDESTENAVRALQSGMGLAADGVVGPATQWLLSTRDAGGPRLSALPP